MKGLATLLVLLPIAAPLHAQGFILDAQEVILDFEEGYPEDQFYFLTYTAESDVTLASDAAGHVGGSTRATWEVEAGDGGLGLAGFGYLHGVALPPNPFPDLSGFTHLSLWYNNVAPAAAADRVAFRFELHEEEPETDADGQSGRQVWVLESHAVLSTPPGWTRLLMPLQTVGTLGEDGFAVVPGGFAGDGVLDLGGIKHWAVALLVEGEPVGTAFEGATLFDYLTAEVVPVAATPEPAPPFEDGLEPGYPNPFAGSTTLAYTVGRSARVSLTVYDVLGRAVAVLVEPQRQEPGRYEVTLAGSRLGAGTYLCVLEVGGSRFTRRVTHVR